MASTASELTWFKYLLQDFHLSVPTPVTLFYDNQAIIQIASNHVFHERTKHIEVDYQYIRKKVQDGSIKAEMVPSLLQLADIFTKPLFPVTFNDIWSKL